MNWLALAAELREAWARPWRTREGRCAIVLSVACCAIALGPIWVTRFIPVLDDPNHLSAMYIWHELAQPGSALHAFYEPRIAPVSYFAYYGLAHLLGAAFGVELAHKLVLSLYVLAFPAIGWQFCRQTGRSAWLSLLTLPFAFSISWAHGYHPFNLGMVAFLWAVVTFDRLLGAPSAAAFALASTAALACYFSHPFPLALLLLCAPLLWLLHDARARRLLGMSAALLPSLVLLRWQAKAGAVGAGSLREVLGSSFPVFGAKVYKDRVLDFPEHAVGVWSGYGDSLAAVAIVVLTLGLWLLGARAWRRAQSRASAARDFRALWLACVLAVAYFVLPEHFNEPVYMWIARGRIAPALGFLLILSVPIASSSRLRWLAAAAAIVLCYLPLELSQRYRDFGRYMLGMEKVLAACPPGEQVLTLRLGEHTYEGFDVPVFRELPSWVQVVHGGYSPMAFDRPIAFPFAVKRSLPAPHWRQHADFRRFLDARIYGCVLTHRQGNVQLGASWKLARESGRFRLYLPAR